MVNGNYSMYTNIETIGKSYSSYPIIDNMICY